MGQTWATRGLLTETRGTTTYYYDHNVLSWSPDGRALALSSRWGSQCRLSVYSEGKLRAVHTHEAKEDYRAAWSPDSKALFAVPHGGANPNEVLAISLETGESRRIYRGPERQPIQDLTWDPAGKTLALAAGQSLVLYDHREVLEVIKVPNHLRGVSWSPDGTRLALTDWQGGITVVGRDGKDAWAVTEKVEGKWFAPNVAWTSKSEFAFILVTRAGGPALYLADLASKKASVALKDDLISMSLVSRRDAPGFLFLKVAQRGAWEKSRSREGEGRERRVRADLFFFDAESGRARVLTSGGFIPGQELEGDFSPAVHPLIHIR